jgi:hypothetical protein
MLLLLMDLYIGILSFFIYIKHLLFGTSVVDSNPNTDPAGSETFCLSRSEKIIPDPAGSEIKWNDKCPHRLSIKLNI